MLKYFDIISGKSDKDHVQDPLDAEKSLQEEEKFGIVHLRYPRYPTILPPYWPLRWYHS